MHFLRDSHRDWFLYQFRQVAPNQVQSDIDRILAQLHNEQPLSHSFRGSVLHRNENSACHPLFCSEEVPSCHPFKITKEEKKTNKLK